MSGDVFREHVEGFWPDRPQEEFTWNLGPIEEWIPGFRVRRVAPRLSSEPWVYLTVGASSVGEGDRFEFLLLAPSDSPRHVETLAMVASFHADPRYSVSLGQTVKIGRPWAEGSSADHLLVSLPYPFGPDLELCDVDGVAVRILLLVPISATEARFVSDQGFEELERLFETKGVDVLSVSRPSLI